MNNVVDVEAIIARIKEVKGFASNQQVAEFLGVSKATVSNWVARNSIDFPLVIEKLKEVDLNWLLTGRGGPEHVPNHCDDERAEGEIQVIYESKTREKLDDRNVKLFDIDAAANLHTLLNNKYQVAVGEIKIPNVPVCDGAVYVTGDSMYPLLKSGDIVGYKIINSFDFIIYGEMYLVAFRMDGDDYLAVKYVNRSPVEGCIRLVSYNIHHTPLDIPLADVYSMGIVKFSIRRHMMM